MIQSLQDTITLHDGVKMPGFGYGCWRTYENETYDGVRWAIDAGYRLIDTAARYDNEEEVGRAVKQSDLPRESVFIVSKIWQTSFHDPMASIEASLRKLGVDYIDAFLMHWPGLDESLRYKAWEAMLKAKEQKKLRSLGVSNFQIPHLEKLIAKFGEKPVLNQIELHPWNMQRDITQYCKENRIEVMAWGPIFRGHIAEVALMDELAQKYQRSPVQITLRWHIQHGYIAIPKSSKQQRISDNARVFDFTLSKEDMNAIDALDCGRSFSKDPNQYDGAEWVLQ